METANLDVTRAEKMRLIYGSMEALSSLTFCVDYQARPNNCGRCSKCIRTKAMFLSSVGVVPDIFLDKTFDVGMLSIISPSKRSEKAFLLDLYLSASKNGYLSRIPGLETRALQVFSEPTGLRKRIRRWAQSIADSV